MGQGITRLFIEDKVLDFCFTGKVSFEDVSKILYEIFFLYPRLVKVTLEFRNIPADEYIHFIVETGEMAEVATERYFRLAKSRIELIDEEKSKYISVSCLGKT